MIRYREGGRIKPGFVIIIKSAALEVLFDRERAKNREDGRVSASCSEFCLWRSYSVLT